MERATAPGPRETPETIHSEILRALRDLRFGSVEVIVHDGRIVSLVRTEKLRLEK
jgi:hypothetical protein